MRSLILAILLATAACAVSFRAFSVDFSIGMHDAHAMESSAAQPSDCLEHCIKDATEASAPQFFVLPAILLLAVPFRIFLSHGEETLPLRSLKRTDHFAKIRLKLSLCTVMIKS